MNKLRIALGALALAVAAVAIVACSKEKTAQQETITTQQSTESRDYTLAEMAEAMSWEEGKAFFENQPIKDYTNVCEKVLNDCAFTEKSSSVPTYVFGWHWATIEDDCISEYKGLCFGIKQDSNSEQSNALGYFEDGKFIIVPITDENGFTTDGHLVVGTSIEIENDSIIIPNGIYTAYYDEQSGRYVAVAVDYALK